MAKQIFNAEQIAQKIRAKRKALGYTQQSLAKELGITEIYMNNVEQAKHLPSNKLMKKIFDKLDIKVTVTVE